MTSATYTKARRATSRRAYRRRTRKAPRLTAPRFYSLLAWSAFVIWALSRTVITVAGG